MNKSFSQLLAPENQLTLTEATDDAIERAGENADKVWLDLALASTEEICRTSPEFTTDLIWTVLEQMQVTTKNNKAMGFVMRKAAKNGWCVNTMRYVGTKRASAHKRPIPIWKSLIYSYFI